MIHHISIAAKEPLRVADVLAELLDGRVVRAPGNFPNDSWFVLTGDEVGTMLEVLPFGTELRPGKGTEAGFHRNERSARYGATHAYISVTATRERILQIGRREGWKTEVFNRGPFEVIEFWIEDQLLIEVATPEMREQYIRFLRNPEAVSAAAAAGR